MFLAFGITSVMTYGAILVFVGIGLRFFVGQRRFSRRGMGGTQQFNSYWSSVLASTFEGVLMIISALALVSGILLLIIESFNSLQ
ncbi:hypothetical protein LZG74_11515 [Dyadobacter sp. CY327]|uniref:hypothetical protein n=1 Tax=Dyadobacter sp. CY327 TaxID=2907301 RepID=UPI001F1BACEC|nr:hypothetical protein [Dyadobacter sp. CY327]MCE7070935.1 hypothetical protein [Dyadobacter sp. CY327]